MRFPTVRRNCCADACANTSAELRQLSHSGNATDSPLFQLVRGWNPTPLALADATAFTAQLKATEEVKRKLVGIRAASRDKGRRSGAAASLAEIREQVLGSGTTDVGILTSMILCYRALGDWTGMIDLHDRMPDDLRRQVKVRQLIAFAYNRRAESTDDLVDRERALRILQELEQEQGPTSETSGLIGRIYKSQWTKARDEGELAKARGYLKQAVAAYVGGFEADWRDVYPGVNAVTLLDVQGGRTALEQKQRLLPVVRFAAEQRLKSPAADYWDHATLLEIAVLENDAEQAVDVLDSLLAEPGESWQLKTTADNLRIIERARTERGEDVSWLSQLIQDLYTEAGEPFPAARMLAAPP